MKALRPKRSRKPDHDKLVDRLVGILWKLNRGEVLVPSELAREFGVTLRTIQRDLNVRFARFGLETSEVGYSLPVAALGKLATPDLGRMVGILDLESVFPEFHDSILRTLVDPRIESPWLMRGSLAPEDPKAYGAVFDQLDRAVREKRIVGFRYGSHSRAAREDVRPYRLLRHNAIWYLAATEEGHLKTFALGRISGLLVSEARFQPEPEIATAVGKSEGIWFGSKDAVLQTVELDVAAPAAEYWKRRRLLPRQVALRECDDGSLRLTVEAAHLQEILPVVRYWIPHVRIVSPAEWQQEMDVSLRAYLDCSRQSADCDAVGAIGGE
ncbi:MAG: WYL domain-containing protein [Burkholderiaceae bacterium]